MHLLTRFADVYRLPRSITPAQLTAAYGGDDAASTLDRPGDLGG